MGLISRVSSRTYRYKNNYKIKMNILVVGEQMAKQYLPVLQKTLHGISPVYSISENELLNSTAWVNSTKALVLEETIKLPKSYVGEKWIHPNVLDKLIDHSKSFSAQNSVTTSAMMDEKYHGFYFYDTVESTMNYQNPGVIIAKRQVSGVGR